MTFSLPRVIESDIEIHHYRTQKGFTKNIGRNLKILKNMYDKKTSERHTYYYARELADNNHIDESILVFTEYLNGKADWEGNIINAFQKLTQLYIIKENHAMALKTAFEGIIYNPHYIELYNLISQIYYIKEDWQRVIQFCNQALTIPKPDALHSVLPKEYDFTPYDRLVFAYGKIGNFEKANEMNEKALQSNPCGTDLERCIYNRNYLRTILDAKKDGKNQKLNLGCGSKTLPDYINCDIIQTPHTDEVFPLTKIPYSDNTISEIYCEHVLEHLSHEDASKSVKEMSRVLHAGGVLQLFIPDLEQCCSNYLNSNGSYVNGFVDNEWYKYTLFGFQKDANGVPADFQYHKTGFNRSEIIKLLEDNNFVIDYAEKY
jgi:predicted SAM-dependent methyltransferase